MNNGMKIPASITVTRYSSQVVVSVFVLKESVGDWCLGLCLLVEGLIEMLTVRGESGDQSIKLSVLSKEGRGANARISLTPYASLVELTPGGIKYLQYFFLRYYRDEFAEVDHIDLEASDTVSGESVYLTIRVADSQPSVSPEEAKKRLLRLPE